MKITKSIFALLGLSLILTACGTAPQTTAGADADAEDFSGRVAIQGYSLVSYFEKDEAELGSPQHRAAYKGQVYHFASADQVETFKANPEQYLPKYGEVCPYSLALGRKVGIDPRKFQIRGDSLLLFHNEFELSQLNIAKDAQSRLFRKADAEYAKISF